MTSSLTHINIPIEQRTWQLKDISLKIGSGATPRGGEAAYLNQRINYAFVRSQNVLDFKFNSSEVRYISDESAQKLKGVHLQKDDILLNITGDGITFSRCCIVDDKILPAAVNQHVAIIRVNQEICLPGYLLAYLCLPETKSYIASFNAGGSRRAITKGHIESFQIPVASKEKQKVIQDTVFSLINKIELNQSLNQTLEQMVQAIFKSWFVDFEPVKAKMRREQPEGMDASTAALFPDKLVESELGVVPEGWELSPLEKLIDFKEGPGIRNWQYTDDKDGVNFINIRCIKGSSLNLSTANKVTKEEAFGKYKHFLCEVDDILVSSSGTLGRYAFVRKEHLPLCLNTSVIRFRPIKGRSTLSYVAGFIDTQLQVELEMRASGSAQLNFGPMHLRQITMVKPPIEILNKYEEFVSNFLRMRLTKLSENTELAALRDTLLPKLLSGEIELESTAESE
jgi:type I restriction enzyme S subunit